MLILQHLPRAASKDPTLTFSHLSVVTSARLLLSNNLLLVPFMQDEYRPIFLRVFR